MASRTDMADLIAAEAVPATAAEAGIARGTVWFLALSVGTSPLDARIVQNNMLPIRENGIVIDKPRRGVELPSVAVDVPAGQTLFLTVSPISDMSAGFGSRVVGAMTMKDVVVHLPVVD